MLNLRVESSDAAVEPQGPGDFRDPGCCKHDCEVVFVFGVFSPTCTRWLTHYKSVCAF